MRVKTNLMLMRISYLLLLQVSTLSAQQWIATSTGNHEIPILEWIYIGDTTNIESLKLFRSELVNSSFTIVNLPIGIRYANDSIFIECIDTTLVKKGVYKYLAKIIYKDGKEYQSPIQHGHNLGYIPLIQFYKLKYTSCTFDKSIHLSWEMTDDRTVTGVNIYRSRDIELGFEKIVSLPVQVREYVDIAQRSNEAYFYFMEAVDYFGRKHVGPVFHAINKFAVKPLPPMDITCQQKEEELEMKWRRPTVDVIGYNIYRKNTLDIDFRLIHQVLDSATWNRYTDTKMKIGSNQYFIRSISDGYLESGVTDTFTFYKNKPLDDESPSFGMAKLDSLGQINVYWESLEKLENVYGYKVCQINKNKETELAFLEVGKNYFKDKNSKATRNQMYKIYAIGPDGKSSENAMSITYMPLSKNENRSIACEAIREKNGVRLNWEQTSHRYSIYKIYRSMGQEKASFLRSIHQDQISFFDPNIALNETAVYYLTGVDISGEEHQLTEGIFIH